MMPLPQKGLIPSILLAQIIAASAAPPQWWGAGNFPVVDPNAAVNNHGPVNIGQAKHMAKSALDALRTVYPTVADQIEADLTPIVDFTIPDPKTPEWLEKQKAPLLIGQLKAIAAPFYTHLHEGVPLWLDRESVIQSEKGQLQINGTKNSGSIFPWTAETADDENKAIANIGQLKAVFSLRFDSLPPGDPYDADGDGLLDAWEIANFGVNYAYGATDDIEPDGATNLTEHSLGLNPLKKDHPSVLLSQVMLSVH